jgi:hypothetical protein
MKPGMGLMLMALLIPLLQEVDSRISGDVGTPHKSS